MSHSEMVTTRQAFRRYPGLGWAAVAVGGLMLALVATLGPPEGPVVGSPAVRLVIALPDSLQLAIFGLFALVALLVLGLLLPRGLRRRRKKGEDEFELVHEEPKHSPWTLLFLLCLILIPLGLGGYLFWLNWTPFEQTVLSERLSSVPGPRASPPSMEAIKPVAESPVFTGAVVALALMAGLGALGVLLWIYFGDRMEAWVGPSPEAREGLAEAVEESLDSLRQEPDPRRAIIMCYRRFEQVLAKWGLPRAPWKTPMEFLRETLRRLRLPPEAVTTLTGLFEISKFSHHPVGPTERDTAVGSLVEIKAALDREVSRGEVA